MLIRRAPTIRSSEITDEGLYWSRREFIQAAGGGAAAALLPFSPLTHALPSPSDEDKLTPWEDVTGYNNFYEFGTDKADPARNATRLRTRPWKVDVAGEVARPAEYDLDGEEQVHREAAADDLGFGRAERVRLLRQREPRGGSPAVEPGQGAAYR